MIVEVGRLYRTAQGMACMNATALVARTYLASIFCFARTVSASSLALMGVLCFSTILVFSSCICQRSVLPACKHVGFICEEVQLNGKWNLCTACLASPSRKLMPRNSVLACSVVLITTWKEQGLDITVLVLVCYMEGAVHHAPSLT